MRLFPALGLIAAFAQAAADEQIKVSLAQNRPKIDHDPRDFVAGNPNGKITVVEFFDYRCPYCKAALPDLQKLIAANKDVRLVLTEFPILSAVSENATRAAIAAKAQGKYWAVHQAMLSEKSLDDAAIERILKANGVDMTKARADAVAKATSDEIDDNHALARATPAPCGTSPRPPHTEARCARGRACRPGHCRRSSCRSAPG